MTQARQSCTFRFLDELLNDVHNGRLIIPPFSFLYGNWKGSHRKKILISSLDLIKSITHNIPIGSIVIYEKYGKDYVLDGHHRLFRLYRLLKQGKGRESVFCDLSADDISFYYEYNPFYNNFPKARTDNNEEKPLHYMSVYLLLNNIELIRYQRKLNNESMIAKSDALSTTFRNHQVAVYRIEINSDDEIKNAYELINENRKYNCDFQPINPSLDILDFPTIL